MKMHKRGGRTNSIVTPHLTLHGLKHHRLILYIELGLRTPLFGFLCHLYCLS